MAVSSRQGNWLASFLVDSAWVLSVSGGRLRMIVYWFCWRFESTENSGNLDNPRQYHQHSMWSNVLNGPYGLNNVKAKFCCTENWAVTKNWVICCIWEIELPSSIGIINHYYKVPYQPTRFCFPLAVSYPSSIPTPSSCTCLKHGDVITFGCRFLSCQG